MAEVFTQAVERSIPGHVEAGCVACPHPVFRTFTVSCAEHGQMVRDETRHGWKCPADGCPAWLSAEDVFQQVTASPGDASNPLTLVVT